MTQSWDDLAVALCADDARALAWSVRVVDLPRRARSLGRLADGSPQPLLDVRSDVVQPSASIGKILLLAAVAARIEEGLLDPDEELAIRSEGSVADSGLLQYLRAPSMRVADLAALVGAVSDNLATNVLLDVVGLDEVAALAARSGVRDVVLHDEVRGVRGPEHPPHLSTSSAAGLCDLVVALHRGLLVTPAVSRHVVDWLHLGADLSMVAGAFGLDPLCHTTFDRGISLWHKTGTQVGVRADAGVVVGPAATVAYAVLAQWPADEADAQRDLVLGRMRHIGETVRGFVSEVA